MSVIDDIVAAEAARRFPGLESRGGDRRQGKSRRDFTAGAMFGFDGALQMAAVLVAIRDGAEREVPREGHTEVIDVDIDAAGMARDVLAKLGID